MDSQTGKLIACIAENLPDLDKSAMQAWIERPKVLQAFLFALRFQVYVDRSAKPNYPDWFDELLHPELECSGPTDINLLFDVEQWRHKKQILDSTQGDIVYRHLRRSGELPSCLNLQDGLAIKSKGVHILRDLFGGKTPCLWGSVARSRSGQLYVPYLSEGTEVVVDWRSLDSCFYPYTTALRYSASNYPGQVRSGLFRNCVWTP